MFFGEIWEYFHDGFQAMNEKLLILISSQKYIVVKVYNYVIQWKFALIALLQFSCVSPSYFDLFVYKKIPLAHQTNRLSC